MKDKGLMGIGTLIIFIAVILVAAVAAAVLISTSGSLQQQALTTGGETEAGVATGAEIFSVTGTNGSDADVEYFSMLMRLQPGSDNIKLNNTVMTLDTKDTFQQLTYGGTDTTGSSSVFNITYLQNGTNAQIHYLTPGDVLQVEFQSSSGIGERAAMRIRFIPRAGLPAEVDFNTPETMISERIKLYPIGG
ncbi:archaellin/type IV pilin N-terminal domain-containing protein [Candidatus Altiarchaeota archaeon]